MDQVDFGSAIGADRPFQERAWLLERIAWGGMLLLVLAALAGLTGARGPLSSGTAEVREATLEYPRIARWQAAESLTVESSSTAGPIEVMLPSPFLETFAIENMTPRPARVTAVPGGQVFAFEVASEPGRKSVSFSLRAQRPALPTKGWGALDGQPVALSFTVLP